MLRGCTVLLIFLPVVMLAQDPDDTSSRRTESPEVTAGRKRFTQTCGFCHGRDGRGASGPDLIRSPLVNHDVNGNLIGEVVRAGRPAKGMPAFQLPDDQIRSIAAFLHAEATGAASVARRLPAEYPLEKLLVGNAGRGGRYFESHCAGCHKRDGDLAHIATRYKPFDLQTKIAFPGGAKPQVEMQEPSGKTVSGTQVYADEFYVTLRDPGGWTHTYKRGTAAKITITDPLREHERLLKGYSDQDLHDLFAFLETFK